VDSAWEAASESLSETKELAPASTIAMRDSEKLQGERVATAEDSGHGVIVSPDTRRASRLPPNQARTRKWPVLDAHGPPSIDLPTWSFGVSGLVENNLSFGWDAFRDLPRVRVFADMHCVTRWSRLGNVWEGVATRELLARARVRPEARFAVVHGYDFGFTTNLPLDALAEEDVLLADTHDGAPISREHGGPLRLVVPRLYAWKSAKWVKRIELVSEDEPGYWERAGYHDVGDPWKEERFR
jgi:DMSO/TMAO reductase YedYZ molybdopterin-dependent catalytic subunit